MKNKAIKTVVFCLMIVSSINAIAQQPGINSETGDLEFTDASTSPISDYIIPMLLIGIVIGYRLLKQKNQFAK
jgi:hypothetical protein